MIEDIRFRNYLCFRGDHSLKLAPLVYGISASRADDEESSNAGGKSAFVESIPLVLYGWHRWASDEDLITRGEAAFEVEIRFAGGHRAMRSRVRGKRTVSRYWAPGQKDPAMNDEADAAIRELVGLSFADFRNSCFFRQKEIARFVTQDPGPRQKTIADWFRLERVEACEKDARAAGAADEAAILAQDAVLATGEKREAFILGKRDDGTFARTPESFADDVAAAELLESEAAATVSMLQDKLAEIAAAEASARARAETDEAYRKVCDQGTKLKESTPAPEAIASAFEARRAAEAKENAAHLDAIEAGRNESSKKRLALAGFDGKCPVAGIECPKKDDINADRENARAAHAAALSELNAKNSAWAQARGELAAADAAWRTGAEAAAQLTALRARARELNALLAKKAPDVVESAEATRAGLKSAQDVMLEARATAERARGFIAELKSLAENKERALAKKAEIEERLVTSREAAVIFKAAQRRVAESTLSLFEEEANKVLGESRVVGFGGPMTMKLRWARETKDLAKACGSCGSPFPTSARVKSCARCGAPRGHHLENKLDVVLSDQSGALDDWAGCLFQLAAARWLREDRSSPWDTLLIDEPFGAMDPTNRLALARHFARALPGFASQSFVIAHSPDVTNSLPGRIAIDVTPNGSVPRVVA